MDATLGSTGASGPTVKPDSPLVDLASRIRRIVRETPSFVDRCRASIEEIADAFRSPYASIQSHSSTRDFRHEAVRGRLPGETWRPLVDAVWADALASNSTVLDRLRDSKTGIEATVCGVPIRDAADEAIGVMVVVFACESDRMAMAMADRLEALASLLTLGLQAAAAAPETREVQVNASEQLASRFESIDQLAFSIVNGIKNKFGFSEVVLGLVRRGRVRIQAISGRAKFHGGGPGVAAIQQALEEGLDAKRPIGSHPELDPALNEAGRHLIQERWSRESGGGAVITLPIREGEQIVAMLGVRLDSHTRSLGVTIEELLQRVEPMGTAITLTARLTRRWWQVAWDAAMKDANRSRLRRLGYLAAGTLLLASVIWSVTAHQYIEAVDAKVGNRNRTTHAAAFAGVLQEMYVRPGDRVEPGTPLFRLDDAPIRLRLEEVTARMELAEIQVARNLRQGDSGAAAEAHAELESLAAEREVLERRIESSVARAKVDGFVVGEDRSMRVGEEVAMGDPLAEVASQSGAMIELHLPDSLIPEIEVGMIGRFATEARPETPLSFVIERVEHAAQVIEGRTVYVAEARLLGEGASLRMGAGGTARVELGERTGAWLLVHRPWRYLRHQVNQL